MKLFTRYSRINVIATIIIFLIASVAFYITLHFVLLEQIDDDLRIEEDEITAYVNQYKRLPESFSVNDQIIEFRTTKSPFRERYFHTTRLMESADSVKEHFRQLVFGIQAGGQWYQVNVSKSLEDTDDLIHSIVLITFITIMAILVVSFFINRVVLKRIWKPFYQALDTVKEFNVGSNQSLKFPQVNIDEFEFMNQSLVRLTRQAHLDYLALKTFSENASHELQTPIAIIRSKLDILIQDENLTEQQSLAVQSAYNAIQKLTKLNQSLLLLAKIENNQFQNMQQINMLAKLQEKLTDFQELWMVHDIRVEAEMKNSSAQMNNELADIMLNNLLINAIQHNYDGGEIKIVLDAKQLTISNTSPETILENKKLFQRFQKESTGNHHNGLGLSIIKQICDVSGFQVSYIYEDELHRFKISWP